MNNDFEKEINSEETYAAAEDKNTPHKDNTDELSLTDNARFDKFSGAYMYSKNADTNGCVWDKSDLKKKNREKGFRVFVVAALSVFAVAACVMAGIMVADFYTDNVLSNVFVKGHMETNDDSNSFGANESQPKDPFILGDVISVETFSKSEGGLTKSEVAAKCSVSAVGIVVKQELAGNQFDLGYFGSFSTGPQTVQSSGSGFIYSKDGYIITNHHVIENASEIWVYLHDSTKLEAQLIGSDALSDIAVIKVDGKGHNLIPMEIGDSSQLSVGDEVIAIGCPAGIEFMGTVTDGIISAINRDVELSGEVGSAKKTMTLLQTNATINKGNSGGPLINTKGQVIGINTLKLSSDYEGIGFSIPMNGALPIISQLIEHGRVIERSENDFVSSQGVIGISASAITEAEAEYYDIPRGVLVVQIGKDTNASKAGLRRGDIITAFNGESIKSVDELNSLKAGYKAGEEVTISVYRDIDDNETDKIFDKP